MSSNSSSTTYSTSSNGTTPSSLTSGSTVPKSMFTVTLPSNNVSLAKEEIKINSKLIGLQKNLSIDEKILNEKEFKKELENIQQEKISKSKEGSKKEKPTVSKIPPPPPLPTSIKMASIKLAQQSAKKSVDPIKQQSSVPSIVNDQKTKRTPTSRIERGKQRKSRRPTPNKKKSLSWKLCFKITAGVAKSPGQGPPTPTSVDSKSSQVSVVKSSPSLSKAIKTPKFRMTKDQSSQTSQSLIGPEVTTGRTCDPSEWKSQLNQDQFQVDISTVDSRSQPTISAVVVNDKECGGSLCKMQPTKNNVKRKEGKIGRGRAKDGSTLSFQHPHFPVCNYCNSNVVSYGSEFWSSAQQTNGKRRFPAAGKWSQKYIQKYQGVPFIDERGGSGIGNSSLSKINYYTPKRQQQTTGFIVPQQRLRSNLSRHPSRRGVGVIGPQYYYYKKQPMVNDEQQVGGPFRQFLNDMIYDDNDYDYGYDYYYDYYYDDGSMVPNVYYYDDQFDNYENNGHGHYEYYDEQQEPPEPESNNNFDQQKSSSSSSNKHNRRPWKGQAQNITKTNLNSNKKKNKDKHRKR